MSLTVHLGSHKTATTHLQASWRAAMPFLQAKGIYYAGPADLRQQRCPLTLALSEPMTSRRVGRARAHFDLVREFWPKILISDENILGGTRRDYLFGPKGQLYPDATERLGKLFDILGGQGATAVLALRDPAQFQLSAFSLQLLRGAELDFDAYLDGRPPWAVGWADLARRILALPQVLRLIVWRYEDYPALRRRIHRRLLPEGLAMRIPNPPPVNVGISQEGYEWMVGQLRRNRGADLRDLAGQARQNFSRAHGHGGLALLSQGQLERSARVYEQEIEKLRRFARVEFLAP